MPRNFQAHKPLRRTGTARGGARCWQDGQTPVLRNRVLASEQVTDIVLLDFSQWPAIRAGLVATLAAALRLGGARHLRLDSREIGSLVVPLGSESARFGIALYDNHPGGAGHVLELATVGRDWFRTALNEIMFVDATHHETCITGCLRCLPTFDAAPVGPDLEFERPKAHPFLSDLLTS